MIKPKLHLNSIIQSRTSFLLLGAVLALTINSFKSDVSRETKDSGDTREDPSKVRFFEHTHDGITHVHRAGAQPSRDNIVGLGGGRSAMLSGRQFAFNWRSISHLLLQQADRPDLFACVFTLDPSPEIKQRLSTFINSPQSAAVLSLFETSSEERIRHAQHLINISPDNGLSYLILADALKAAGRQQEAVEAFKQAVNTESFDAYFSLFSSGTNEVLKESGLNEVDLGIVSLSNPWRSRIMDTLALMLVEAPDDAFDDNDYEMGLEVISDLRNNSGQPLSIDVELDLLSSEECILRLMYSRDPSNQIAEQRLTSVLQQIALGQAKKRQLVEALNNSNQKIIRDYFKIASELGQKAAFEWILGDS